MEKKNISSDPILRMSGHAKRGKLPKKLQPPKSPAKGSYSAVSYNTDFYYE